MEAIFALTRLCQFGAGMVVCGSPLFYLYGLRAPAGAWTRRLVRIAGLIGAAATLGWMMAQAAAFGAGPGDALKPEVIWAVASGTSFGHAAALRLALFLLVAAIACAPASRQSWALAAAVGAGAVASFGWTGHGVSDDGAAGVLHLGADVVHLIAAAVWLGALAPLAILALRCRPGAARTEIEAARHGMAGFSGIGLAVVAVVMASGLVNGWFLVGPGRVATLAASPYGLVLLGKLALFVLMLGLAAVNRYRLTPALERSLAGGEGSIGAVRLSLCAETLLGLGVLACVAFLGTLIPPVAF